MEQQAISLNGKLLQVLLRDEADRSVCAEIFKLREYRAAETIMEEAADPIIDIGAHSGLFSLYVRALNATVPIIAVEPEPKNLELLAKHLLKNKIIGVEIVPAAVSGQNGKQQLVVSSDSHDHHLLEAGDDSGEQEIITVATMTLSDLMKKRKLKRVSLIKIDIEGGEYAVFESLGSDDFAKIGAIIMEYHNYNGRHYLEIENILRENGFGVQVFPSKFDKRMGFIFVKNKRV
ncbi:MAG: FkbM family methyltransferase [Candidatus Magasanikbacteria bacterium]|nr:FkbM family methyltransferase [Candidatus Magasanikbacteria bacterium]